MKYFLPITLIESGNSIEHKELLEKFSFDVRVQEREIFLQIRTQSRRYTPSLGYTFVLEKYFLKKK